MAFRNFCVELWGGGGAVLSTSDHLVVQEAEVQVNISGQALN